jgi:PKD domain
VTAGGTSEPDLQAALDAADAAEPGSETIDLGPGTFAAAGSSSFTDSSGSNAISIVGSGEGSTTITANNSSGSVLDTSADSHASVSDLSVDMGSSDVGLRYPNDVTDVAINGGDSVPSDADALMIQTGTVTSSKITMALGNNSFGVYRPNESVTINGLTVTADTGFELGGGDNDNYSNLRIFADENGITMPANNGTLTAKSTITDSEIVITGTQSGAAALTLDNSCGTGCDGTLDASFLTLVGNGEANSIGVQSYAAISGSQAAIDLSDSIVEGFETPLLCYDDGAGSAGIDVSYSDFDAPADESNCQGAITTGSGNIDVDPDLVMLADGDEPVAFDSPTIGEGDPTSSGLSDLLGNPRPGAGSAHVGMGAFEYQRTAPTAVAGASPSSVGVGAPVSFSAAGSSDVNPGDSLSYSWSFDDGASASGASATHAFATAGVHHATLTVSAPDGLKGTADAQVTVTAPAAVAPQLSDALLSPARFRSRGARPGRGKRHQLGSKLEFTLSEQAAVAVTIERLEPGRKRSGACVAPAKHKPTCTRRVKVGSLQALSATQGMNTVAFGGSVGGHPLKPGHYEAKLVASTSGDDSQPATARFTIVAR